MLSSPNFTIYNASAGSGKTFTLAERYLTLVLSSPKLTSFQNILAITFTNKAVGEMKSRILDYLTLFTKGELELEEDAMFKLIKKNTNLSSAQIQKKSNLILKEILNNYAAFEVSTIDAFTHRIIRTFAKDLGLSMNFDIEMDTQQVLQLAVERVVDKAGSHPELTEVLIDFALEKISEDKSGQISQDIFEASKLLLNEKDQQFISALKPYQLEDFTSLKRKLKEEIEFLSTSLKNIGDDFLEKMEAKALVPKDFTRSSIPNYFQKLSQGHQNLKFDTIWQADIENEQSYVNKNQTEAKKQVIFGLKEYIIDQFQQSKDLFLNRKFYDKIYKNITQLSLLNAVSQEVDKLKTEQNILLISDFNEKISTEIKKQPAPFIFERLGEKFQHYFIDEFQDTSKMQWENLIPLTGNALASMFDHNSLGSLTLVGDAKQSIYAWRGGDAHQFINLSSGNSPFPVWPNVETLDVNYRSNETIVEFNNQLFQFIGNQLQGAYVKQLFEGESLLQSSFKTTRKGFVNLKFIEAKTKEDQDQRYPEEVLKIIKNKQEQGFNLGDICILVRRKKEGVAIANYLNEQQIPLISSETLLINTDEQVQFLVNFLKVIHSDNDDITKANVMEDLCKRRSYSEEKTYQLLNTSIKEKAAFWESIAKFGFGFDLNHFHSLPLYDAVEYLINTFELHLRANAYLQFFLDEVFEFTLKKEANLSAFLSFWEKQGNTKSIISSGNDGAVQIMTVHKSKGLQFPVVIYPYANEQIDYTQRSHLWVNLPENFKLPVALTTHPSKDIEHPNYVDIYEDLLQNLEMESVNILYVALTRASEELFILSEDKRSQKSPVAKLNTISGLLMSYAEKSLKVSIDVDIDYSWGELTPPKPKSVQDQTLETKELVFHSPSPKLNLSLVTTAGKLWSQELEEALEEGNLMHSFLSRIKDKNDIEASLSWHIENGLLEEEQKSFYEKQLKSITTHNQLVEFYSGTVEVLNEQDIYFENQILRPDRVNLRGREAVIIDYKTGLASEQHQQQLETYSQALTTLKYNVKKRLLVYIRESIDVKIV